MSALESSVFQVLFQAAWKEYENRTGTNSDQHPLIHQLQTCHSFESLISLLQGQARTFDEFRSREKGEKYNVLVNLFESIAIFLHRLEIYIKIPPTAAMTEIVVKILVELLSTLALAAKQMSKKAVEKEEIVTVLKRLDRLTQDEARTTAAQTFQVVYGLVQDMRAIMDDFKESTDNVREALMVMQESAIDTNNSKREQFQEAIQKWLSPPDPWENHGIALKAHHNGTSAWFIQSDTFAEWKSSGSPLWIHGKLGCGKTILCSAIIEDIYSMCKAKLASLAFFYFGRDDHKKDLRSLLSSLIFQLYDQSDSYFNILSAFHSAHRCGSQYPSDIALAQCLKDMLSLPGQAPIYVILDGIDECPKSSNCFPTREDVLTFVEELVGLHLPNLHICVSSRPEVDITAVIAPLAPHSISLHNEAAQKEEIVQYVRSIVDSKPGMRNWAVEDKELVIELLLQKADGMFRWVICQLDVLPNCSRRIQRFLNEVPASLAAVYERILEEIPDTQWECARLLLECLLVSFRPLRVEELAEFLTFDFDAPSITKLQAGWRPTNPEDDLPSMCSGLLSIEEVNGSKIVQFTHPSVKEFLLSRSIAGLKTSSSRRHIDTNHAHNMVVRASLAVLLSLDGEISMDSVRNFPLANYAARHWMDHIQSESVSYLLGTTIQSAFQLLLDPKMQHFTNWISAYNLNGYPLPHSHTQNSLQINATSLHYPTLYGSRDMSSLVKCQVNDTRTQSSSYNYNYNNYDYTYDYGDPQRHRPWIVATVLGHLGILQHFVSKGVRLVYPSSMVPLHLASRGGHLDAVRFLLENGFTVTKDGSGQTPLHYASQAGHLEVIELLLERGADVISLNNSGHTPLHYALQEGHLEVAQLLLDRGADPNALDGSDHTPLHWALQGGRLEVIRLLLERGANVNGQGGNNDSPLHWALQEGHLDFAQLLLECGADINSRDALQRTPLHLALQERRLEVAQLLLERGVDIDSRDGNQRTPLHYALQEGHHEVARLLIERGAYVNAQDVSRRTPLHYTLQEGHLEVARLLLERGAGLNTRDVINLTPLHCVLQEGSLKVAELLLKCGADANARDGSGRSPFIWALREGRLDVVRLLLEHGKNTDTRDQGDRTPLLWALQEGRLDIAELLLERGENVDSRHESSRTPLHAASQDGRLKAAEFLLEHDANANTQDETGQTPLHLASRAGHSEVTQLLLKRGAYPNARDGSKRTPLHFASQEGGLKVAELLLDHGAYSNARDKNKWTPMHSALQGGHLETTQLLLDHGAYANTPDSSGQTPLHLASREGHLEIAQLLLDRGVYVDTWDANDRTPLHWAAQVGCLEVTRILLERGADSNSRDNSGQTALHLASEAGLLEVSELLLDHGADANAKNDSGQTALHLASLEGHLPVVQSLLTRGMSNFDVQNYEGRTASHEASARGHHDIVQLLSTHGG